MPACNEDYRDASHLQLHAVVSAVQKADSLTVGQTFGGKF